MTKWIRIVVPLADGFSFPDRCPGCLRPQPEAHLRIESEKSRLIGFYLISIKWEHLRVIVPFCEECAKRQKRWGRLDTALLLAAAIASLSLATWFGVTFDLSAWAFWGIFLITAVILTMLCKLFVKDNRAVRIERHSEDTVTFRFSQSEYALEFAQLNRQAAPVFDSEALQ